MSPVYGAARGHIYYLQYVHTHGTLVLKKEGTYA